MNPIKAIRTAKNFTQVEAAERAGMPQHMWSRLERRPTLDETELATLRRVAAALRVPIARLCD